ncbi:MAG TPA: NrfD/PsrC family molybdoenzyme membrane anchor subunit [Candidatus Binataceae bacterium]|nr:NrfD/PsrC family molybdoenzyme membrane anchor subunit [Candidatus Binataceae bacterium]
MAAAVEPINPTPTFADIDRGVHRIMEPPGLLFWAWIGFCATLVAIAGALWTRQIYVGLGVTGLRQPTMWAVYITNFVFWVGIAHSGTLISAILYLFRTRWRTAVYRFAETMTLFAVATAGLFPLIHLGRVWNAYWLLPYPNERDLQPNFRSPLVWDAFAVSTYLTISATFLLMGLIPDVANTRDAATGWRKTFYAMLAFGWRGTDEQWRHFQMMYLLLAGLATPLVISVHSVVSWDFAMAQLPGWHSTIFAPYFVAGAILSGVAMVLTLLIPIRRLLNLEEFITPWHLDNLAKVILLTSLVVTYSYITESFMTWYGQDQMEVVTFQMRYWGPYGPLFWLMAFCNCVAPLSLFSPRLRRNPTGLFIVTILINIGMWLERFVIIAGSLATNFNPSQWGFFHPSITEIMITVGSFAWFVMLFSLFSRYLPIISMTELKEGIRWLRQSLRDDYYPGVR